MWNGLIRNNFNFFWVNVKLYNISETPWITYYITTKLLAKNLLGSHLKCQLASCCPIQKKERQALNVVQVFANHFQQLPGTPVQSGCLTKGAAYRTHSSIAPLRFAADAVVLTCDFSVAFSVLQGMFRAQHTRDLWCCPAALSSTLRGNGAPCRKPLLFSHIKTLTPHFC